jgi:hypothetical protein
VLADVRQQESKNLNTKRTERTKKKAETNVIHNKSSILLSHNSIARRAPISFFFVRFVRFVFKFLACCSASTHGAIRFALFCDRALCRCGPKTWVKTHATFLFLVANHTTLPFWRR